MLKGIGLNTGMSPQNHYRINGKIGIEPTASKDFNHDSADASMAVAQESERASVNKTIGGTARAPQKDPIKERQEQSVIRELINIEKKVIAHEQAHMAAGSGVTGASSYSYTNGPDGKRYISGGEVAINVPATDDPKKGKMLMQRVIEAALAPADPSPQDIKVAQSAQSKLIALNQQILMEKGKSEGYQEFKPRGGPGDRMDQKRPEDQKLLETQRVRRVELSINFDERA